MSAIQIQAGEPRGQQTREQTPRGWLLPGVLAGLIIVLLVAVGGLLRGGLTGDVPPSVEDITVITLPTPLGAMSPDGAVLLTEAPDDAPATWCVQRVGIDTAARCLPLPLSLSVSFTTWTRDGQTAAIGPDLRRYRPQEGFPEVHVIDVSAGTVRPLTRSGEEQPPLLEVALHPIDELIAAVRLQREEVDAALIALRSGETQMSLAISNPGPLLWAPDGQMLWVNGRRPDPDARLTGIDISTGERRGFGAEVELQGGYRSPGVLIQVSADGSTGLLALHHEVARGSMANLPLLALIDLVDGRTAPVLPDLGPDQVPVSHALLAQGVLSTDGRHVVIAYSTDLPRPDGPRVPIRISRVEVGSILDGDPVEEVLIEDLGAEAGLAARLAPMAYGATLVSPRLGVDGRTLTLLLRDLDADGRDPTHLIQLHADRNW